MAPRVGSRKKALLQLEVSQHDIDISRHLLKQLPDERL